MRDLKTARLNSKELKKNFEDIHPPLTLHQAYVEASRCYYCFDAPCLNACPTKINIPSFIKKIAQENTFGAAKTILDSNIMGGTCARVCPVEELCEEACVRNTAEDKPVTIGNLQKFATDHYFLNNKNHFIRKSPTNKKIAIVGAGPAGLSCAHGLAHLGHDVEIFETKSKPGGLNEYGLAAYKMVNNFAAEEIKFILSIGGIKINYKSSLGKDFTLQHLQDKYDAVFLSFGLNSTNKLNIPGENLEGVMDAVDFISQIRQSELSNLSIGKNVVVIGAGNTGVDIAVQSKRLGSENVSLVYRRGYEQMNATIDEKEFLKLNEIKIYTWAQPKEIKGTNNQVSSILFSKTKSVDGKLVETGEHLELPADYIFKAIGQNLDLTSLGKELKNLHMEKGKIKVSSNRQTNLSKVWAGGDCISDGIDLTVYAVEDGKMAAASIDHFLGGTTRG